MTSAAILPDGRTVKLGCVLRDPSVKQLAFADYLTSALPAPPASRMWLPLITYGEMLNAILDDCVVAALGHSLQVWTYDATAGGAGLVTIPDPTIQAFYSAVCGYIPGNPATDVGMTADAGFAEMTVNGLGGYKLDANPFILPSQTNHVKQGINLFGVINGVWQLPVSCQAQTGGGIWDVPAGGAVGNGAPGSWGVHSTCIGGFDANYLYLVTWGQLQKATWAFWMTYAAEAYGLLSVQWLKKNGTAPSGLKLAALLADAKALAA